MRSTILSMLSKRLYDRIEDTLCNLFQFGTLITFQFCMKRNEDFCQMQLEQKLFFKMLFSAHKPKAVLDATALDVDEMRYTIRHSPTSNIFRGGIKRRLVSLKISSTNHSFNLTFSSRIFGLVVEGSQKMPVSQPALFMRASLIVLIKL